jgi:CheY-like chemotaxis protein
VILLDLCMPDMDAEAFLFHGLRQVERDVPVVLLSASPALDHHAVRLGVNAAVAKPFDVDALCLTVRQVVAQHQAVSFVSGGSDGR